MTTPKATTESLQRGWAVLAGRGTSMEAHRFAGHYLAVDSKGCRHVLILRGPRDPITHEPEDLGALHLGYRNWCIDQVTREYLDVTCVRSDLVDLFDGLVLSVFEAISSETERPAALAVREIRRWQSLLLSQRRRLLSEPEQIGLFAELSVLLNISGGASLDPARWRGPRREPQDIRLPGCRLEVKGIGLDSTDVRIHGLQQLETNEVPVGLVVVTVIEDENGRTLPQLVDEVLDRSRDRAAMRRLLVLAGYQSGDAEHYSHRRAGAEYLTIDVDDEVPRIVPGTFADGVPVGLSKVRYHMELDALRPLAVGTDLATLMDWIDR